MMEKMNITINLYDYTAKTISQIASETKDGVLLHELADIDQEIIQVAVAKNKVTYATTLYKLLKTKNVSVIIAVIENPKCNDEMLIEILNLCTGENAFMEEMQVQILLEYLLCLSNQKKKDMGEELKKELLSLCKKYNVED